MDSVSLHAIRRRIHRIQEDNVANGLHRDHGLHSLTFTKEELAKDGLDSDELLEFFMEGIPRDKKQKSQTMTKLRLLKERMSGFDYRVCVDDGTLSGFCFVTARMKERAVQFGQFTFHDATHTTNKKGYKLSPVTVITADNEHQLMAVSIFKSEGLADQMWQFRALADMLPHWATNVWVLSAGDGAHPTAQLKAVYGVESVLCHHHQDHDWTKHLPPAALLHAQTAMRHAKDEAAFGAAWDLFQRTWPTSARYMEHGWIAKGRMELWAAPWTHKKLTLGRTTTAAAENTNFALQAYLLEDCNKASLLSLVHSILTRERVKESKEVRDFLLRLMGARRSVKHPVLGDLEARVSQYAYGMTIESSSSLGVPCTGLRTSLLRLRRATPSGWCSGARASTKPC